MYSDRGNVIVTCDEEDHILKQGHIIFLKPNHFHNIRADHNKPSNVFIMSFEAKSCMLDFLGNKIFKLSSEMKEFYGKTYLSGIFKRVYNVSIMNYYTNLKIEEAKCLIRENKMTITEISDLLGFSSPQYFSKRFSQIIQMSPQQYSVSIKEKWKTEVKN